MSQVIQMIIQRVNLIPKLKYSSISGGMSSLAAICITDFIKPLYLWKMKTELNEKKATIISKLLGRPLIFALKNVFSKM